MRRGRMDRPFYTKFMRSVHWERVITGTTRYSETCIYIYIKTTLGNNKMWTLYTGGLYMQVQSHGSIPQGTCKMWSS